MPWRLKDLILMLRPLQWLKNLMVYFPPFLGGTIFSQDMLRAWSLVPFAAFCMASSSGYIINDLMDCGSDAHHPVKSKRVIPSGRVSRPVAGAVAALLCMLSLATASCVSLKFLLLLGLYLVVTLSYSLWLKHMALLDLFCISAGFVIRLFAGGSAFSVPVSEWLFLCVFLLSLFLSAGKRMAEKQKLGYGAARHRKVLDGYPDGFLEGAMLVCASSVLVTYAMYVISRHSQLLLFSVPLCCFGLFRYMLRVQRGMGGDPTESLVRDVPLLVTGTAWAVMVGWGVYG